MAGVWTLEWPRGRLALHAAGGMLNGLRFLLDDGRAVEPLYRAPWLGEEGAPVEGVLANLCGEFVCLPYGTPASPPAQLPPAEALQPEDLQLHGYPAAADWTLLDASDTHLSIGLEFTDTNALRRLVRTVRVEPGRAAVTLELTVEARWPCRRSVAFHPSFALSGPPGSFEIVPDGLAFGLVQPEGPESGFSRALPGSSFDRLGRVPLAEGGFGNFRHLPFPDAREEILMLCGVQGGVTLNDRAEGVSCRLEWDAAQLPSLVLWMSNRGRLQSPWNGRNLCVGIEPCAAAFGGILSSLSDNGVNRRGIPTAVAFHPDQPTRLGYSISAAPLSQG